MGGSPDTSGQNAAAMANAAISREAWDWYKNEANRTQGIRDEATDIALQGARASLQSQQAGVADRQYAIDTFRPIEQRLATGSINYDTPERRAQAAAEAGADVSAALSQNRQATMRELARRNGSMSGGRMLAMQDMNDVGGALAQATARNAARRGVEQTGYGRMLNMAQLGRGMSPTGGGSNAGAAAGNVLQAASAGQSLMSQGANTAINGMQSAGNLYGQIANTQAQAQASDNQTYAGLAAAAMTAIAV